MPAPLSPQEMNIRILLENVPFDIHFNGMHVRVVRMTNVIGNRLSWEIPFHAHESYEFHYISAGEGYIDIENTGFEVKEGDFYITAPYVRHRQTSHSTLIMEEYCLECMIDLEDADARREGDRDITQDEMRQLRILTTHSLYTHFKYTEEMMGNFHRIEDLLAEEPFGRWMKIEALLTLTLLDSLRIARSLYRAERQAEPMNAEKSRIIRIKNYLDSNLCQPITIQDVAKEFYLSPRQVDRILVKEYGMTFHQYLTNLRMKMAIHLLEEGQNTAGEVALDAGFSSYQQMYRVLRRNGYRSPGQMTGRNAGNVRKGGHL